MISWLLSHHSLSQPIQFSSAPSFTEAWLGWGSLCTKFIKEGPGRSRQGSHTISPPNSFHLTKVWVWPEYGMKIEENQLSLFPTTWADSRQKWWLLQLKLPHLKHFQVGIVIIIPEKSGSKIGVSYGRKLEFHKLWVGWWLTTISYSNPWLYYWDFNWVFGRVMAF